MPSLESGACDLMPHLFPIWDAFNVLNRGRQSGMDVCRLPVSEIYAYLDGEGVEDTELRHLYLHCLQEMDHVFIEVANSGARTAKHQARKDPVRPGPGRRPR